MCKSLHQTEIKSLHKSRILSDFYLPWCQSLHHGFSLISLLCICGKKKVVSVGLNILISNSITEVVFSYISLQKAKSTTYVLEQNSNN